MSDKIYATLLDQPLKVINVGLDGFAEELERQSVAVVRLDWQPPAGYAESMMSLDSFGN